MSTVDTTEFRVLLERERARIQSAIQHLHDEHPGNMEDELGEVGGRGSDNHLGDMASVTWANEGESMPDGEPVAGASISITRDPGTLHSELSGNAMSFPVTQIRLGLHLTLHGRICIPRMKFPITRAQLPALSARTRLTAQPAG